MYELIHPSEEASRNGIVGVRRTGELTAEDYDRLAPTLEEKAETHGPLRVLVLMEDWEGWLTKITKPLAEGKLRYFDRSALEAAWAWVQEGAGQEDAGQPA